LTARQLGEVAIKVLGIYFAASALIATGQLASGFALPGMQELPELRGLVLSHVVGILGVAVTAGLCLVGGRAVATRLLSDHMLSIGSMSRRDWLFVGISLVGVFLTVSGMPTLMQVIAKALWYLEGSRQPHFWEAMGRSSEVLVSGGLSMLVGIAAIGSAAKLSTLLDAKA
jgi:hypothetical protein